MKIRHKRERGSDEIEALRKKVKDLENDRLALTREKDHAIHTSIIMATIAAGMHRVVGRHRTEGLTLQQMIQNLMRIPGFNKMLAKVPAKVIIDTYQEVFNKLEKEGFALAEDQMRDVSRGIRELAEEAARRYPPPIHRGPQPEIGTPPVYPWAVEEYDGTQWGTSTGDSAGTPDVTLTDNTQEENPF